MYEVTFRNTKNTKWQKNPPMKKLEIYGAWWQKMAKPVCSARDYGWGSLGYWGIGYMKDPKKKNQDAFTIREYNHGVVNELNTIGDKNI